MHHDGGRVPYQLFDVGAKTAGGRKSELAVSRLPPGIAPDLVSHQWSGAIKTKDLQKKLL